MYTAVGYASFLRAFRLALQVEGLRPRTIQNYASSVERFAKDSNTGTPREVTPNHVRAFIVDTQDRCAPKTVHELQLGLRRFFRFCVSEGDLKRDPTHEMKLARYQVRPQPTYSEAEVERLLLACATKTRTGLRDRALIMVLFDTGVREGELVSMGVPGWSRGSVEVNGKTGVRTVFLGSTALLAVERYARQWDIHEAPLWRGSQLVQQGP